MDRIQFVVWQVNVKGRECRSEKVRRLIGAAVGKGGAVECGLQMKMVCVTDGVLRAACVLTALCCRAGNNNTKHGRGAERVVAT